MNKLREVINNSVGVEQCLKNSLNSHENEFMHFLARISKRLCINTISPRLRHKRQPSFCPLLSVNTYFKVIYISTFLLMITTTSFNLFYVNKIYTSVV